MARGSLSNAACPTRWSRCAARCGVRDLDLPGVRPRHCARSPHALAWKRARSEETPMTIATQPSVTQERPSMAEIDVCGMTHPGLVRATNADHFLVASFHRMMRVHATSLGEGLGPQETQNRGFLLLVA